MDNQKTYRVKSISNHQFMNWDERTGGPLATNNRLLRVTVSATVEEVTNPRFTDVDRKEAPVEVPSVDDAIRELRQYLSPTNPRPRRGWKSRGL